MWIPSRSSWSREAPHVSLVVGGSEPCIVISDTEGVTLIDACHCDCDKEARRKTGLRLRCGGNNVDLEHAQPASAPPPEPQRLLRLPDPSLHQASISHSPTGIHSFVHSFLLAACSAEPSRQRQQHQPSIAHSTLHCHNNSANLKTRRVIRGPDKAPTHRFAPSLPSGHLWTGFRVRPPDPVSILSVSNTHKRLHAHPLSPHALAEHLLRARRDPAKAHVDCACVLLSAYSVATRPASSGN